MGQWQALARAGQWPALIGSLMADHYDPLYERSMLRSYPTLAQAPRIRLQQGDAAELAAAAQALIALHVPA